MIWMLSKCILQEFGKIPEKIGIKNLDSLLENATFVSNETDAFLENINTVKIVFESFKNCVSAFRIIN